MHDALPGADLIEAGFDDLRNQRETVAGLLVAIGASRLRRIGFELPDDLPRSPQHRLYQLLAKDNPDSAHSRYNACLRRLIVFEHTAEHALHIPSSNTIFRSLVESIIRADYEDGASAIRNHLQDLQSP